MSVAGYFVTRGLSAWCLDRAGTRFAGASSPDTVPSWAEAGQLAKELPGEARGYA